MKKSILRLMIPLAIICLNSCNKDPEIPESDTGKDKIALEIFLHSTTVDQTIYINREQHADFLSTQIISAIESNAFLRQKMNRMPEDTQDTIFSYDEIPYIRETKTETRIYSDGATEFVIDDLTPFSVNMLHQLSENPESEESRISKTIIKEGYLKVFNSAGDLVASEAYETPDMKAFIDSVRYYLQAVENNSATALSVNKLNALSQMNGSQQSIKILPDNKVRIEAEIQPDMMQKSKFATSGNSYRAVTELNPEMTRTLKFEVYDGNQLIQRKLYNYDESVQLKSYHHKQLIAENPSSIESQTITLNNLGQPVIKDVREVFYRNQMIFHE